MQDIAIDTRQLAEISRIAAKYFWCPPVVRVGNHWPAKLLKRCTWAPTTTS